MSTSRPSSTCGSSASCWVRLNRCTSSRNRIVPLPCSPSRPRARSTTSRTSFTPAETADRGSNALLVAPATRRATVVLPVPGGPQRITDESRSDWMSTRSGRPGPSSCSWPTTSSRFGAAAAAARGARRDSRSSTALANRSTLGMRVSLPVDSGPFPRPDPERRLSVLASPPARMGCRHGSSRSCDRVDRRRRGAAAGRARGAGRRRSATARR